MSLTSRNRRTEFSKTIVEVEITDICRSIRARYNPDPAVAHRYAKRWRGGSVPPPCKLVRVGAKYWVADGDYVIDSAIILERPTVPAVVCAGTKERAVFLMELYHRGSTKPVALTDRRQVAKHLLAHVRDLSSGFVSNWTGVSDQSAANYKYQIWGPATTSQQSLGSDGITYSRKRDRTEIAASKSIKRRPKETAPSAAPARKHVLIRKDWEKKASMSVPILRGEVKGVGKLLARVINAHLTTLAGINDANTAQEALRSVSRSLNALQNAVGLRISPVYAASVE